MNADRWPEFDIEPSTLLENIRQKLNLKSKWRNIGKTNDLVHYENELYCLAIRPGRQRDKIDQIMVSGASAKGAAVKESMRNLFILVAVVMSEVDPLLGPKERNDILAEITDVNFKSEIKEKVVNGITYSCTAQRNENLYIGIQKISIDQQIKGIAKGLIST